MPEPSAGTTFHIERSLGRLAAGDPGARDELFAHAQRRLLALTRLIRRDFPRLEQLEESGDIVQETSLRLCRALEKVRPTTAADFFGLAALHIRRELVDMVRRHFGRTPSNDVARPARPIKLPYQPETSDAAPTPVELAQWSEFHEAVDQLPEVERKVFDLLWYHDLPQIEAAAILNLSERQLRRHWVDARFHLQQIIPTFFEFA
ncbi:MAG: sigma-70 family RNA polymerase sigma factor [Planctomycetes bacterium]|nr:sigma-70 family RNA polymerase sigma factor [Planctomycetota bacterium]